MQLQSGWFDCEESWAYVAVHRNAKWHQASRSSLMLHKPMAHVDFEFDAGEGDVIVTRLYKASPLDHWFHFYVVRPDGSLKELTSEEISKLPV